MRYILLGNGETVMDFLQCSIIQCLFLCFHSKPSTEDGEEEEEEEPMPTKKTSPRKSADELYKGLLSDKPEDEMSSDDEGDGTFRNSGDDTGREIIHLISLNSLISFNFFRTHVQSINESQVE